MNNRFATASLVFGFLAVLSNGLLVIWPPQEDGGAIVPNPFALASVPLILLLVLMAIVMGARCLTKIDVQGSERRRLIEILGVGLGLFALGLMLALIPV